MRRPLYAWCKMVGGACGQLILLERRRAGANLMIEPLMIDLCGSRLQPRHRDEEKTGALAPEATRPSTGTPLRGLKTHAFKLCRLNTYVVREASLKNKGLKLIRINTYEIFPLKYLWNEHLRKNPGGWGLLNRRNLIVQKEVRP